MLAGSLQRCPGGRNRLSFSYLMIMDTIWGSQYHRQSGNLNGKEERGRIFMFTELTSGDNLLYP